MKQLTVAFPLAGRKGDPAEVEKANLGGAEISTLILTQFLSQLGVKPIYLVHNQGPTSSKLEQEGQQALTLNLPYLPKREVITEEKLQALQAHLPTIRSALEQHQVDIIHSNDASMHRSWGYLCQHLGYPHIWHERGLFSSHPPIARQWLDNASHIIAISDYTRSLADPDLYEKISIIQDPLTASYLPQVRKEAAEFRSTLRLPENARLIAMIANGNKRKRWDLFAKIAAKTRQKYPNYHFACIGLRNAKDFSAVNSIYQNKGGDGGLLNLGYQDNIQAVIAACDCLLATAQQEPLGRTPIEAIFVGTPVVASAQGGHVETLADACEHFLSPYDNPLSYTKLIRKVVHAPQKHQDAMAQLRIKLQKKHDPLLHAEAVARVYRNLPMRH